jgi:hypothetical protein
VKGERGEIGPQGKVGPIGLKGKDGKDGEKGESGLRGPKGEKGDPGIKGRDSEIEFGEIYSSVISMEDISKLRVQEIVINNEVCRILVLGN